jgi:hypothetical protein
MPNQKTLVAMRVSRRISRGRAGEYGVDVDRQ